MYQLITLAFIALLFTSCGAGESSERPSRAKERGTFALEASDTNELATKINFLCGESECPDSYGLLIGQSEEKEFYRCSGFFISKNQFATTSQCLRSIEFNDKGSCNDIVVKDLAGNISNCSSVRYRSIFPKYSTYRKDFAIIELGDEMDVSPVKLSLKGFGASSSYSYWKTEKLYSEDDNTFAGDTIYLKKMSYCRPTSSNIRVPQARYINGLTTPFRNCPLTPGSEGAAIINSNNEVVGSVWGRMEKMNDYSYYMSGSYGKSLTLANSLVCVASERPDIFSDQSVTEEQKERCQYEYKADKKLSYFTYLTKLFFFDEEDQKKNKVILAKSSGYPGVNFFRVKHPACFRPGRSFRTKICYFFPRLTSSYEIISKRFNFCYENRHMSTRFVEKGKLSTLEVLQEGKVITQFAIDQCSGKAE